MFGYKPSIKKRISQRQGGIAIVFDGGYSNQLVAASILEKYGGRGTFFPNYASIGAQGVMTASEIVSLSEKGHEIGCYAGNGSLLTTMTETDADTALRLAQSSILSQTGILGRSCSYTLGAGNLVTHRLSSRYYDRVLLPISRFGYAGGNTFIVSVPRSVIDTDKQNILDLITYHAKQGKVLTIRIHKVSTTPAQDTVSPSDFEEMVALAYAYNMPIGTLEQLTPPYNMVPDPWWEYAPSTADTGMGWMYTASNAIASSIVEGDGPWGGNALVFGSASGVGQLYSRFPTDPLNSSYQLRIPHKITGLTAGSLNITVLYYDQVGTYISSTSADISVDTDWALHKVTLTTPANTREMSIRLTHSSTANAEAAIKIGRIMLYPTWAGDFGENPS